MCPRYPRFSREEYILKVLYEAVERMRDDEVVEDWHGKAKGMA